MQNIRPRRFQAVVAPVAIDAREISELFRVASKVQLIVGLTERTVSRHHFRLIVPLKAGSGNDVEHAVRAIAIRGGIPSALGFEVVDVLRIDLGADVARDVGVRNGNAVDRPGHLVAATHDQLHVRGGHQVTWAIDGVPIPNTNIASNVGPQIDPKDIDYLEAIRGGYSSAYGDRTYGVFNVVPRTGFERNNEAEVVATYGAFGQTNDQLNFGSHTEKFSYFASINGNRSDYGLETAGPDVLHDRVWGLGGMGTLIYNRDANNQFRFVTSMRRDDYQVPNDPDAQAAGVRDAERERDALANFSWVHIYRPGWMLTVSPFYHYNRANYHGDPHDTPVSTTQHQGSQYGGAQIAFSAVTTRHNASVGVYGFGQHDDEAVKVTANDATGLSLAQDRVTTGHMEAAFLEDQYKALSWLTLTAGVRLTHFSGAISENAASPQLGGAIRIPHLNWVLRGFWGKYYQAPPLSTVIGPLLDYAVLQGLGFIPLRGERDEEHQFGLTIPMHGWVLDVNNYHQRARNYFDHNAIGNSNVFFPLTIDGARLYGWEVSMRSPRIATVSYTHLRAHETVLDLVCRLLLEKK